MQRTNNIIRISMFLAVALMVPCYASFNFSNRDSALVIDDYAALWATNSMQIDGGGLIDQGYFTLHVGPAVNFYLGRYSFYDSVADIDSGMVNPGQAVNNAGMLELGNDPATGGDTMIFNPGGLQGLQVAVYPGDNVLRGQPLFLTPNGLPANGIQLYGTASLLAIAVQNTLDTNIVFNSASVNGQQIELQDDLRLGSGVSIIGDGSVNFNARRLSVGGADSVWNGNLIWIQPDLQLYGDVTLNGIWFFYGQNGQQLNGHGTVIDLSGGGALWVIDNSDIAFSDVYIRGIGEGEGSIIVEEGSTLHFSNVTVEVDSDYYVTTGTWQIDGPTTVITGPNILQFATSADGSTQGHLAVNNTTLNYDTLMADDNFNIRPVLIDDPSRTYVTVLGNGVIAGDYHNPISNANYLTTTASAAITRYVMVGPDRPFPVSPAVDATGKLSYNVTLDANSYFMGFTKTDQQVFFVSPNVQATTQNMFMRELSPDHIALGAGANLTFGDSTQISLNKNEELTYPWYCTGNVLLRGSGAILDLSNGGALVVTGTNSVLTLDCVIISGVSGNNIRCLDASSKIVFKDVKLIFADNAMYGVGGIDIMDDVTMVGPYTLSYLSSQPLRILPNSTLYWIRNFGFTYAPASGATNLLQLLDFTSILSLDEATLTAAGAGLALTTGQLYLRDQNYRSGTVTLARSLTVDQPSGATFEQLQ